MQKLECPALDPTEVFLKCVSRVRNATLRESLTAIAPHVGTAVEAYRVAAASASLHELSSAEMVGGVTAQQLADVYTYRMAKAGAPGRPVYDLLLAAPAHGRCPLCAQRTVSTLDHHLPKMLFPALAVAPANLVPACADCNWIKGETAPGEAEVQTLHPYFDDVSSTRWLYAVVHEEAPASLRFEARPPNAVDGLTRARIQSHFRTFALARLYASHAAEELVNIRHQLSRLHEGAGATGVQQHLAELAESREQVRLNSWQTATYRSLADSLWYCSGGFA
jgi:hypothetical protein